MQRLMTGLARGVALIGGIVLLGIIVMNCLSISGRTLGLGEITGNYEILEAGIAFAIFSFLPICQLYSGHATVDVFTSGLGRRSLYWLRAFWEIVLSVTIIFITWRLYGGFERYWSNGETTLFLQFPVWWSYGASFVAAVFASLIAVYCAYARTVEAITGKGFLPDEAG